MRNISIKAKTMYILEDIRRCAEIGSFNCIGDRIQARLESAYADGYADAMIELQERNYPCRPMKLNKSKGKIKN